MGELRAFLDANFSPVFHIFYEAFITFEGNLKQKGKHFLLQLLMKFQIYSSLVFVFPVSLITLLESEEEKIQERGRKGKIDGREVKIDNKKEERKDGRKKQKGRKKKV